MTKPEPLVEGTGLPPLRVRLYIAGTGPNSASALANLKAALDPVHDRDKQIEIIDVLKDPERALRDGIFVTPMLVKLEPTPERRILGTLRDRANLLGALGIEEVPHG